MGSSRPGTMSTIRQLLYSLRGQFTSILFVGPSPTSTAPADTPNSQHKPSDLTLEEVRGPLVSPLFVTYPSSGSRIRTSDRGCPPPREIPSEFIPRHRSDTTRDPYHDLLPSPYRGRVFGIPSLPSLAIGPDLIPVFVDQIFL